MPRIVRVFRLFVSSTFGDLGAERAALQADVFPPLRELCSARGAQFQAIDLRWGVTAEASLDQQAVTICLEEVARCQKTTQRPNFLLLLGDRYGWRPPPPWIPSAELAALRPYLPDEIADDVGHWYVEDRNAAPPRYVLRHRDGQFVDERAWQPIEQRIRAGLGAAALACGLGAGARRKYEASITQQEVELGTLRAAAMDGRVHCFIRTVAGLPRGTAAGAFVDLKEGGIDAEAKHALQLLKRRLRRRLGPAYVHTVEACWDHERGAVTKDHLDALCAAVYRQLASVIEDELARTASVDTLEQEHDQHRDFGDERARMFVGRAAVLGALAAYRRRNDGRPLVVIGPSGVGKTALLARARQDAVAQDPSDVVLARFVGATPRSADVRTLLQDLCRALVRLRRGPDSAVPVGYVDLVDAFRAELEQRPVRPRLTILLDALDQLTDGERPLDLAWLPTELPPGVALVVSVSRGPVADAVQRRLSGPPLDVPPMSREEGEELLARWLRDVGRTLQDRQHTEVLAAFVGEGLPLQLRLGLEEARRWKSFTPHEQTRLERTVPGLVRQLLARLRREHVPTLVDRGLSYLAAARNGLTEDELLDVLSLDDDVIDDVAAYTPRAPEIGPRLPVVYWSRLFFDLEPYLNERRADGKVLLGFYHRQLTEVIKEELLAGDQGRERHRHLARYFATQELRLGEDAEAVDNLRKLSELPYQQTLGELWNDAYATLTDFQFLERKVATGMDERVQQDGTVVRTYSGVLEVQDDLERALQHWPRPEEASP